MKLLKRLVLIIIPITLVLAMCYVLSIGKQEVLTAVNGQLEIDDGYMNDKIIALDGEFLVFDRLIEPEELLGHNNELMKPHKMTLDELRVYTFPEGVVTAVMQVDTGDNYVDGIILEELYTSSRIFINGELMSVTGQVSEERKATQTKKESQLISFSPSQDTISIVIQIANHEKLSGQLKKHIFLGQMKDLVTFWNKQLIVKYVNLIFYLTAAMFFLGLYLMNQKHKYILTLAIAGILNGYIILSFFEPFIIFQPEGVWYLINSWLQTLPTLLTQFLSSITVLLFLKQGKLYKQRKRLIRYGLIFIGLSVLLLIIFDKSVYSLYIIMVFLVLLLMVYSAIIAGLDYLRGRQIGVFVYAALLIYLITYTTLVILSLGTSESQTLTYYSIYFMFGQMFFYGVMSYITVTDFSRKFYLAELNEIELEKLVVEKTEELSNSYDELLKQDQSRRQMLSDISHDLRSPITVVKGYMELIKTGKIKKENLDKYMDIIFHKMSYVSDLVNDLLYLAKIERNTQVLMDLEQLDEIVKNVADPIVYKEHSIQLEFENTLDLECNYSQIYRLFTNLIDNAVEHSDEGTVISIRGKKVNHQIKITVQDFGEGIQQEVLPHIFDRFVRSDETRNMEFKHFGLGLAIAKSIVHNHNGHIECESELGKGTVFTISFPTDRLIEQSPGDEK